MLKVDFTYVKDGKSIRHLGKDQTFVSPKFGTGKRLVIAEAPGETESHLGEPLVGGSGQFFDSLCNQAGVRRDSLTLCNTIQCRPPDNIFPLSSDARAYISKSDAEAAVEQCYRRHVAPLIQGQEWTRIDTLGERALGAVTGLTGITRYRGSILSAKLTPDKFNVVATYHPSYLMRSQSEIPVVISDLRKSLVQPPERYNLYPSVGEVEGFNYKSICIDIETNRYSKEIYLVGISGRPFEVLVVPFKSAYKPHLRRILLEAEEIIGWNLIQFDLPILCEALEIEFP